MSWAVDRIGKAGALIKALPEDFERTVSLAQPERAFAEAAATLIDTVLESMPAEAVVKVKAYGSQTNVDWTRADGPVNNSLNITIEPIYGFVE